LDQKSIHVLKIISPNILRTCSKNKEQLELENLERFDLVAQEQYRVTPAQIFTKSRTTNEPSRLAVKNKLRRTEDEDLPRSPPTTDDPRD
jgi:hypothetical protein